MYSALEVNCKENRDLKISTGGENEKNICQRHIDPCHGAFSRI